MNKTKKTNNLILCCIIYIVSASLFILLRIGSKFNWFSFLGSNASYYLNVVNQVIFISLIPILLYSLFNKITLKRTFEEFKFKKISIKMVGNSFLLGVVMFGIIVIISTIWGGIIELTGYKTPLFSLFNFDLSVNSPLEDFLLGIAFTCVLPAFGEEILLRGCVLKGVESMGRKKAIIICGLLFGFLHLNINQFAYTFIIGMLLAVITLMMNSIWPAIIIHFTSNFCSVFSSFIYKLNLFNGGLNKVVLSFYEGSWLTVFLNTAFITFVLIFLFVIVFVKFIKYSRSRLLYEKLQSVIQKSNLKEGEKLEINEETSDALIQMRALVENEVVSQFNNLKKPFDFVLPPNENDKRKISKKEWLFVVFALSLTGIATMVGFIGGIL